MLGEVSAHGGHIADLLGPDFRRGLMQTGKRPLDVRVSLNFRNRDEGADGPCLLPAHDFVQAGQRLDVHQDAGADQVILEQAQQVIAAGEIGAICRHEFVGTLGRMGSGILKGVHTATAGTLPSAASTFAGVIGRLETRTPRALATALAMAAAVGPVAGSPMPMTPRSGILMRTTSISGTSAMPGSLEGSKLGLRTRPQSWTATTLVTVTRPVSVSTVTSANCTPQA